MKYFTIIAVVLLALVGFYFSDSTPTENINTFESKEYGISFKIPEGYTLREEITNDKGRPISLVLIEDSYTELENTEGPTAINIEVYSNPNNLNPDQWIDGSDHWLKGFSLDSFDVKVDGNEGKEYFWDGLYAGKSLLVSKSGNLYSFSVTWMSLGDEIISDFETVLESVEIK